MSAPFNALSNKYYSIPKAQLLFQPDGEEGFFLLGDADDFELTLEVEEQERRTNEEGVQKLVLTVVTSVDPVFTMTLMQLSDVNRALSLLGAVEAYTQAAAAAQEYTVTGFQVGRIYQLPHTNINPVGLVVTDTAEAVTFVAGTDYKIDLATGMVQVLADPGGDGDMKVAYAALAVVADDGLVQIGVASKTANLGKLIVRGTNEVGPQLELTLNQVQIRPAGGRQYISATDFDGIEIEGKVFVDSTQAEGYEFGRERLITAVV